MERVECALCAPDRPGGGGRRRNRRDLSAGTGEAVVGIQTAMEPGAAAPGGPGPAQEHRAVAARKQHGVGISCAPG